MADDDRATVAAPDAARHVFRTHTEAHQGRVVDMAGDAVLAVFGTATGAVAAAATLRERIRLVPKTDLSRAFLASARGHLGKSDDARQVWCELRNINPKSSLAAHLGHLPFQNAADPDRIKQGLAKAALPD